MREVLWRVRRRLFGSGIMRGVEGAGHPRRALMLYSVHPFRFPERRLTHQNGWQSRELARALSERGYAVDVVDYHERRRGLLVATLIAYLITFVILLPLLWIVLLSFRRSDQILSHPFAFSDFTAENYRTVVSRPGWAGSGPRTPRP